MSIKIIKPFGPSIVKARLTLEIVEKLNSYIDQVINDNILSNSLDYGKNLVGNVKQEIELDTEIMKKIKWGEFLGSISKQWVEIELKKNLKDFRVINSWVVRQFKNEYNPIHWHGGDISGVGYLLVPKQSGKTFQENK